MASLVPTKVASRILGPDGRPSSSPRIAKESSLPLDEDQFDIPTFLRRQGQTEMP